MPIVFSPCQTMPPAEDTYDFPVIVGLNDEIVCESPHQRPVFNKIDVRWGDLPQITRSVS